MDPAAPRRTLRAVGLASAAALAALGLLVCAGRPRVPVAPPGPFNVGYRVVDLPPPPGDQAPLTVAVWYPTHATPAPHTYGGPTQGLLAVDAEAAPGRFPLLVFSHGYGGGGLSAVFLTEALAARGWVVVAPDHHDRDSAVRIRAGQQDFDRSAFLEHAREIARSGPAQRQRYLYRVTELAHALAQVLEGPLGSSVDPARVAVGGHSFGGFTALGLAGPLPEHADARVRAVLLFSTGAGAYLYGEDELARVGAPAMVFLGEREREQKRGEVPMADLADKLFRSVRGPKYLVEVRGATHFSFNDRLSDRLGARLLSGSDEEHDLIRRYAVAFLARHVEGDASPGALDAQDPGLTRLLASPR